MAKALICCILVSCTNGQTDKQSPLKTLNVTIPEDSSEAALREVASSIGYIPLETNNSVLINEISNVMKEKDVYYVSDGLILYKIQKELYLSVWNKENNCSFNIKADKADDDLGIGGLFPLPVGISGKEELVGALQPRNMDRKKVRNEALLSVLSTVEDEDNPVLVFYTLR